MTDVLNVDGAQIAEDFRQGAADTLPKSALDSAIAQLNSRPLIASSSLDATLTFKPTALGTHIQCTIKGGETFEGYALGIVAASTLPGAVNTADVEALYANTSSFVLNVSPVYVGLVFFDDAGNALGSFQSGAIGVVVGVLAGTGSWS